MVHSRHASGGAGGHPSFGVAILLHRPICQLHTSSSSDVPPASEDHDEPLNITSVTGNQNQTSFYPFDPHEISVLVELILGHLRYLLTDVPPQPNSLPDNVFHPDRPTNGPWV
ncbi:hypothetical protein CFOL_v3_11025 [Cephalotus follicularis]|uniref:Regulator of rDNA transcription protein 15 n=1 Tax=Cephalotus follicularis TaxID=3775 RepID=A0A1Q3BHN4_CEPFO|nr:hypothetical protein CFOL_v3_11025 [Cephalotus follicularis]